MVRRFRPAFVHDANGVWVAIDDLQPVGVAMDGAGNVLDVASWNHLPAPRQVTWPWREVRVAGAVVWVHDRPDGPTVRIDVSAGGGLTAVPEPLPGPGMTGIPTYSRFARSGAVEVADDTGWRFTSALDDTCWAAEVSRAEGDDASTWSLGPGSIVGWGTSGRTAAVCVRRAPKRPWTFRPEHDLLLVGGAAEPVAAMPGGLDVAERCWPRPGVAEVARLLTDYLPFTVGECTTVHRAGGVDIAFTVHDLDGLPRIESTFRLPADGPRFVHVDEPIDELGRLVGLRLMNITLDEDINGSTLYRRRRGPDEVVYL